MYISDYESGETDWQTSRMTISENGARRRPVTSAPLEMHIHLTNGSAVRFIQPDAQEATSLLAGIHPNHFFRKPHLLLSGNNSLTTIPSAAVEEIRLQTELFPVEWSLPAGIADVVEFSPETVIAHHGEIGEANNCNEIYGEFEMRSGRIIYTRMTLDPLPGDMRMVPMDRDMAFLHLLERAALFGRRAEGGIFLLNPVNVVRMTNFAPPSINLLPDKMAPAGALPAGQFFS